MKELPYYSLANLQLPAGAQENGDLRLQEGDTPYTGRVELYMNDTWGTVEFDYGLTATEEGVAQTICTQLGYGAQTAYGTTRALRCGCQDTACMGNRPVGHQ